MRPPRILLKPMWQIIKKIFKGEDVLVIRQSTEKWDQQFIRKKWDFLIDDQRNQGHIAIIAFLCQRLAENRPIKILDIGCGNGALAKALGSLATKNYEYYGLDISQAALDRLRNFLPNAKLILTNAESPPILSVKFDLIVFSEVLYYLNFRKIFETYKNLLNSEGLVIISLYDTWRTRLIWWKINRKLNSILTYKVYNENKGVSWKIKLARIL